MEAIILAGGLGTRLRSMISDVPKCMAPVAGEPFLYYLLKTLEAAGFKHVILSLGYKHEIIEDWIKKIQTSLQISTIIEQEPLGTGGAVKLALTIARQSEVFIFNGDTFLGLDYAAMLTLHKQSAAQATLGLKEMHDFDRYGVVELDKRTNQIVGFKEKRHCVSGLINGGVYLISKKELDSYPAKFSLEKDYFEAVVQTKILSGYISQGYFIDIGIPEDYLRAQDDFGNGTYACL